MKSETQPRVIFIAEMRNPRTNASSTQIMTRNILYGLTSNLNDVVFVAVVQDFSDNEDIKDFYSDVCSNILFLKESSKHKSNVVLRQLSWLKNSLFPSSRCISEQLKLVLNKDCVVISQSPAVDTAIIGKRIKRIYPSIKYIQYWGDPLALSLISPEEYSWKRFILKCVENVLHKPADRVVFGTDSLFHAEMALFPQLQKKASSCIVCYSPKTKRSKEKNNSIRFGYYGNYFTKIRNIVPLYEAFLDMDGVELVLCGSSDIKLNSSNSIIIQDRVPQNQVEIEEEKTDVEICLLNSSGIQIPGKVFYHTNTDKIILVILDGPRKKEIYEELSRSNRFIFCENTKEDIMCKVQSIVLGEYDNAEFDCEYYSPTKNFRQLLGEPESTERIVENK